MSNVLGEIKSVLIPKEEYERLKSLCARAAEALEAEIKLQVSKPELSAPFSPSRREQLELIAQLRKEG